MDEVRDDEEEAPEVWAAAVADLVPVEEDAAAPASASLPPVASADDAVPVPVVGDASESLASEEAALLLLSLPPWSELPALVVGAEARVVVVPAACAAAVAVAAVAEVGRTVMKLDEALTSTQSRS